MDQYLLKYIFILSLDLQQRLYIYIYIYIYIMCVCVCVCVCVWWYLPYIYIFKSHYNVTGTWKNIWKCWISPKNEILSIFAFMLSFRKNKYQIQSYITFNMDDSQRSLHMKTYFLRISQKNGRFCLVSLGNPTFSNIFFHVPDTFWWLLNYERCVHVCVSFRCIFLYLLLSSQQASIALWTILIFKFWWWLLKPKR